MCGENRLTVKLSEVNRDSLALAVLVSAAVINVLFGCVKLLNLFQIRYYLSYSPKIVDLTFFSREVDFWVWAVSFFVIVVLVLLSSLSTRVAADGRLLMLCFGCIGSFLVFLVSDFAATLLVVPLGFLLLFLFVSRGFRGGVDRFRVFLLVLLGVVCLLVFVELGSVSAWVSNIFGSEASLGASFHWSFAWFDVQLFNVGYPLTSWLFIVLLYGWILFPLGKGLVFRFFGRRAVFEVVSLQRVRVNRRLLVAGLVFVVLVAAFVAYYACFGLPSSGLVGTDSTYYFERAQDMSFNDSLTALQRDRPVSDFVLYFVQHAAGLSSRNVVLVMPLVCAVGLALAVFWFVRVGIKNDLVALAAALFSSVSFQMTVSVFAYSLANWLALIGVFVFLAFLLKSFEVRSWWLSGVSAFVGVLILLTHPYTWDVVMAVLVLYFVWVVFRIFRKGIDEKADLKRVFAVLAINVGFYVVYSFLPFGKAVASGGSSFLGLASPSLGLSAFVNLKHGLDYAVQSWVGGFFAAPLLIVLSSLGLFSVMDFSSKFNRLSALWVVVPSLLLFFFSPESYFFYRILYLLPCQVLAALGVFWVFGKLDWLRKSRANKMVLLVKIGVLVLVFLFLLNYALRSVDGAPVQLLNP